MNLFFFALTIAVLACPLHAAAAQPRLNDQIKYENVFCHYPDATPCPLPINCFTGQPRNSVVEQRSCNRNTDRA